MCSRAPLRFLIGSAAALFCWVPFTGAAQVQALPNILWITSEDNGPHLGCYGDEFASTPRLDALSRQGARFARAWSNAPVCAPARTTLITGVHASSLGAENMRSAVALPHDVAPFPILLQELGYFCTNHSKTDYNLLDAGKVWDLSGGKAHWRRRAKNQPFFSVFNLTITHESRIRNRPHRAVHDPDSVPLPAYHPDKPEVRQDWAQYYDRISEMDSEVGSILDELEADGLTESTIVFYFADHGSGMPRSKRWPYNSGLHVPLIVRFPEQWKHLAPRDYEPGARLERLVSFVDMAPTTLSLAGEEAPTFMQGSAFAGSHVQPGPTHLHGYRGRMDERYDLVRSITDGRFVFIRNYLPQRPYGQYLEYMFQTPTTRVWKDLYDRGELEPPQTNFWEAKPPRELYDLLADPDEVQNLAGDVEYRPILERLQAAQRQHSLEIHDLGFIPECEWDSSMGKLAPMDWARDGERYDLASILAIAERASSWGVNEVGMQSEKSIAPHRSWLQDSLQSPHWPLRYWAAMGLGILGLDPEHPQRDWLGNLLNDSQAAVRVAGAELLIRHGLPQEKQLAIETLLSHGDLTRHDVWTAVLALNTLDALAVVGPDELVVLKALPTTDQDTPIRFSRYVEQLLTYMLSQH